MRLQWPDSHHDGRRYGGAALSRSALRTGRPDLPFSCPEWGLAADSRVRGLTGRLVLGACKLEFP